MNSPDANGWADDDYRALIREANKGAFRPEHWLCISASESGLAVCREYVDAKGKRVRGTGPFAQFEFRNKAGVTITGARGLTQMMPKTLTSLGFVAGNEDFDASAGDYRELSVTKQIAWSGLYFQDARGWTHVKRWLSPGDLYLCNFMPNFLGHKDDASFVLTKDPEANYVQNKGFDRDKKGYITVGDVGIQANHSLSSSAYVVGVTSLNAVRQSRLNECLPSREPLTEDGRIGPLTLTAVIAFRIAAGLPGAGGFDSAVDTALFG